jgi:hypothetical protein
MTGCLFPNFNTMRNLIVAGSRAATGCVEGGGEDGESAPRRRLAARGEFRVVRVLGRTDLLVFGR